jgi:hypothetical protein
MSKEQKDAITEYFAKQYHILTDLQQNIECDLYVCFEGDEEIRKLTKKRERLTKAKIDLILLYSSIIAEF